MSPGTGNQRVEKKHRRVLSAWVAARRLPDVRTVHLTDTRQNPDTPSEKPKLQSYQVDLNQCGPMMLDALVSLERQTWY